MAALAHSARCESCSAPFPQSARTPPRHGARLDDSFLVLPGPQQQLLLHHAGGARSDMQSLTNAHEQMQQQALLMSLGREAREGERELPLCAECAAFVLHDLEGRIDDMAAQNEVLQSALDEERRRAAGEPLSREDLERECARLALEEQRLADELDALEREQSAADAELGRVRGAARALSCEEEGAWRALDEAQLGAQAAADEETASAQLLAHCTRELRRLRCTSAYDDVFDIWFEGPFGTINGLRLGRLPGVRVEWAEVNAALGHAALLADTLARHHHLTFPRHAIHPLGSFSKVSATDEPRAQQYELYGSGGVQLGRIFSGTRFDRALSVFLGCVGALLAHARTHSAPALGEPPYRIEDDRIGSGDTMLSVRLQFNAEELWTRAMKYLLTDLKWLLAWHTHVSAARQHAAAAGAGAPPGGGGAAGLPGGAAAAGAAGAASARPASARAGSAFAPGGSTCAGPAPPAHPVQRNAHGAFVDDVNVRASGPLPPRTSGNAMAPPPR